MPKKNNVSEPSFISIHSYVNGFSFFTQDSTEAIESSVFDDECQQVFESMLHYSPDKKFERIQWISHEGPALFIPESQFLESKIDVLWEHFAPKKPTHTLVASHSKEHGFYVLYEEQTALQTYLEAQSQTLEKKHALQVLFQRIMEHRSPSKANYIYVHISQNQFDLFVFKNSQFELTNSFALASEENFLYFLFYVIEQMRWEADTFSLVFLGKYKTFSSYYEAARSYQSNIEFIEAPNTLTATSKHPSPFLANLGS